MIWTASSYAVHAQILEPPPKRQAIAPSSSRVAVNLPGNSSDAGSSNYILGAGDTVEITVLEYEEYTGEKVILPDGTLSLPLLGSVPAAGLTVEQLAQSLTERLQTYLVNPVVTVVLNALRPVMVNVSGEVQRPGPVQLSDAEKPGKLTLSTALTKAGGITQEADIRQVVLRRYSPNGDSEPIVINLWEAITSDRTAIDPILNDGDSIFVPRLTAEDTTNRRLLARSSFSPATVRVRVVGEVTNPGEVQVPPDSSLSSAVAIAGGPTADARLSRVAFIRMNEDGQVDRQVIDLRNLTDKYQVQDGDVIIVPKRDSSSVLDFATRLTAPFSFLLNFLF